MAQESIPVPSRWSPRQVVFATLFIAAVGLSFWLLYRFRSVVFIFFIAIVLGTAIKPAVNWLARRGLPRAYGEVLIYLLLLGLLVGFLLLAVPLILEQSTGIADQLSGYYQSFRTLLLVSPSNLLQRLGFRLPIQFQVESLVETPPPPTPQAQTPPPGSTESAVDAVAALFAYLNLATRSIFSVVAVLLMGFYWTLEGDRAIRNLLLLVPADRRENIRTFVDAVETKVGGFVFGQGILSLAIAGLTLALYLLIGMPYALALAVIAGVTEVIPLIGPALGALPAVLVASSQAPEKIPWVLGGIAVIQFLENNILVPRVMDRSVGVHPLLTLLSFAALSSLFGLPGALLAIPFAAIVQLLLERFVTISGNGGQPEPQGRDYLSMLRLQAQEISQDVRKQVRKKEEGIDKTSDQLEDSIEAIANDLDHVLAQAGQREAL